MFSKALLKAAFLAAIATNPASSFTTIHQRSARFTVLQAQRDNGHQKEQLAQLPILLENTKRTLQTGLLSAALIVGTTLSPNINIQSDNTPFFAPSPANAESSKVVGSFKGSGLVFKDTLKIERFEDPKVQGVVLYISNFERPVTEKLSGGNFFNDPSYASVACARTGTVSIADNIAKGPGGEEVFEESRSLLFKTLRVQRVYDEEKKTVVYVSYNTRLDKGDDTNKSRFKSSLCAVNLE
jgi:catabolite regulation protein CreA